MGNKLKKFEELKSFSNVIEPNISDLFSDNFPLKGKWNSIFFKNNNPIVLDVGCGKGEYIIELSKYFVNKNFIGIDKKGNRIYDAAKQALENSLKNVAFVRCSAEFLNKIFNKNEIDEIIISFPEPQQKIKWHKRCFVSAQYLNIYLSISKPNTIVHLKTDSNFLYYYTIELLNLNNEPILENYQNIYEYKNLENIFLSIKTYYENIFLNNKITVKYLKWQLSKNFYKEVSKEKLKELMFKYPRLIIDKRHNKVLSK